MEGPVAACWLASIDQPQYQQCARLEKLDAIPASTHRRHLSHLMHSGVCNSTFDKCHQRTSIWHRWVCFLHFPEQRMSASHANSANGFIFQMALVLCNVTCCGVCCSFKSPQVGGRLTLQAVGMLPCPQDAIYLQLLKSQALRCRDVKCGRQNIGAPSAQWHGHQQWHP